MLLERLSEYADQIAMPPAMYHAQAVRYVIGLDSAGHLLDPPILDRATTVEKRGPEMLLPDRRRAHAIKAKLLADHAGYVFGMLRGEDNPERARATHAAFVDLTRRCAEATGEPAVAAVAAFLEGPEVSALVLPATFDPGATITFEVDGALPVHLPSVRQFWAKEAAAADEEGEVMQCLVCGQMRPCVERLAIPIKGIPGNTTGMALISANSPAFESYGLEASLIAPTCEECGLRFGYALNALLSDERTHVREGGNQYIFWTREQMPFSVALLLSRADEADVREFLTAAWRAQPEAARLDVTPFYAATLSGNRTRVVVRDWIETTLGEAQRHLQRYFALQRLLDIDGRQRWFSLWALAHATVNANSRQEEPAPQVGRSLLRLALHGDPLPDWLLYQTVRRTRAEQRVTAAQAALIKMVMLSQQVGQEERGTDMAELDLNNRDQAYLCGRLLAELEAVQRAALGKVNRTIVDAYYGTASTAPASVFGRLMNLARAHLTKLRHEKRGAYIRLNERLEEILAGLDAAKGFPNTLSLKGQGMFALGFYHQRAHDRAAARAYKAKTGGVVPPDDVDEAEALSE